MPTPDALKKKREKIKREIAGDLDILAGSPGKSPAMAGHSIATLRDIRRPPRYADLADLPRSCRTGPKGLNCYADRSDRESAA